MLSRAEDTPGNYFTAIAPSGGATPCASTDVTAKKKPISSAIRTSVKTAVALRYKVDTLPRGADYSAFARELVIAAREKRAEPSPEQIDSLAYAMPALAGLVAAPAIAPLALANGLIRRNMAKSPEHRTKDMYAGIERGIVGLGSGLAGGVAGGTAGMYALGGTGYEPAGALAGGLAGMGLGALGARSFNRATSPYSTDPEKASPHLYESDDEATADDSEKTATLDVRNPGTGRFGLRSGMRSATTKITPKTIAGGLIASRTAPPASPFKPTEAATATPAKPSVGTQTHSDGQPAVPPIVS